MATTMMSFCRELLICAGTVTTSCASVQAQNSSGPVEAVADIFADVAARSTNAVVQIYGYGVPNQPVSRPLNASGFVIRPDGFIATNNHVVEGTTTLIVEFVDGRKAVAKIVGADPLTDLAVVRLEPAPLQPLPALTFADQGAPPLFVGDWVVAIGYPLGLEQTVTTGIVSATNRNLDILSDASSRKGYEAYIQTDAAINRGNSGGPLLDLQGRVVGVNAAIKTTTGGSEGLGFAIPAQIARHVTEKLIEHGRVPRGFLGIDLQALDSTLARSYGLPAESSGILVTSVAANLPAQKSGFAPEDIIIALNGTAVRDTDDFRTRLAILGPGATATMRVFRKGAFLEISATLAEMPAAPIRTKRTAVDWSDVGPLGISMTDGTVSRSAVIQVQEIAPGSPAHLADIRGGDIITAINSLPIADFRTQHEPAATPAADAGAGVSLVRTSDADWLTKWLASQPSGSVIRFTVRHSLGTGREGSRFENPIYIAVQVP